MQILRSADKKIKIEIGKDEKKKLDCAVQPFFHFIVVTRNLHTRERQQLDIFTREDGYIDYQKSVTLPFLSQSPYLVGSGPLGPPTSPVYGFVLFGYGSKGFLSCFVFSEFFFSSSLPVGVLVFEKSVFSEKNSLDVAMVLLKQSFAVDNPLACEVLRHKARSIANYSLIQGSIISIDLKITNMDATYKSCIY